ncbi:hypothetical protein MKQ70_15575 [Chitinophaga sedimenti]|uniref:hypothetical protein n=1 Tax=Chitinophaga sedimenti TaxID=2033606 RepID=UPI002005E8BA|nr:hypothetical protein [Chitinophaga sedimenti]MCK7556356.1 hypothetical protein [Chitinophaga sedimenti]
MRIVIAFFLLLGSIGATAQQKAAVNPKLEALKKEKGQPALQAKIKALENGNADDLQVLIQYYAKDSLKRVATVKHLVRKYPESQPAMMVRLQPF